MRSKKSIPFKQKAQYAALVDGGDEIWYLRMLLRNEPNNNVHVKPEIPSKKTLDEQYKRVAELIDAEEFDKVFWIIDNDTIEAESRLIEKGKETPQQKLERYTKEIDKAYNADETNKKIIIIRNNPCLEYWLLLHFDNTGAAFNNCDEAGKKLKKHLPDYEKSQRYYTRDGKDIYKQLKPTLSEAIKNAGLSEVRAAANASASISQMHLLFKELGIS